MRPSKIKAPAGGLSALLISFLLLIDNSTLTLFSHITRRGKEEERRKKPHLASARKNDPKCLKFGG